MRVLIITDDIEEWLEALRYYLTNTTYKHYKHGAIIENKFIRINITDSAEMIGRVRYTNILIDKFVNNDLLEQIRAHQIVGVEYTSGFYVNQI